MRRMGKMDKQRRKDIKRFLKSLDHTPDGEEAGAMYEIIYELLDEIKRLQRLKKNAGTRGVVARYCIPSREGFEETGG